MTVYWVNYDLNKTGQKYQELIAYLKSHDDWAKPLESSMFVKTGLTSVALRDGAKKYLDSNDSILVMEVSGTNWAVLSDPEIIEWMHKSL